MDSQRGRPYHLSRLLGITVSEDFSFPLPEPIEPVYSDEGESLFHEGDRNIEENNILDAFRLYREAIKISGRDVNKARLASLTRALILTYPVVFYERRYPPGMPLNCLTVDTRYDTCPLFCYACYGVFVDPVTDVCGHSYCRLCLEEHEFCLKCSREGKYLTSFGQVDLLKVNIAMSKLTEMFASVDELMGVKTAAFKAYRSGEFRKAVNVINSGMTRVSPDVYLMLLRCKCFISMGRADDANADLEAVFAFTNRNVQAFLLQVQVMKMRNHGSPILTYLKYFTFNSRATQNSRVKKEFDQVVRDFLQPIPAPTHEVSADSDQPETSPTPAPNDFVALVYVPVTSASLTTPSTTPAQNVSGFCRDHENKSPNSDSVNCATGTSGDHLVDHSRVHSKVSSKILNAIRKRILERNRMRSLVTCHGSSRPQQSRPHGRRLVQAFHKISRRQRWTRFFNQLRSEAAVPLPLPDVCQVTSTSDPKLEVEVTPRPPMALQDPEGFLANVMKHVKLDDIECPLCFKLLIHPTTTPCGHTFCKDCLNRSFDHAPTCPMCKEDLYQYFSKATKSTNECLHWIVTTFFAGEMRARESAMNADCMRPEWFDKGINIPIFVCAVVQPGLCCPLQVFEPRYKLMIRRCMESGTNLFGMCGTSSAEGDQGYVSYGTILHIVLCKTCPDGRSFLNTIGRRRFRVVERSMRDGYDQARVEYLMDDPIPEKDLEEVTDLMVRTYEKSLSWFGTLSEDRMRLISPYGPFPAIGANSSAMGHTKLKPRTDLRPHYDMRFDGPDWMWYMTAILPVGDDIKLSLLSCTSLVSRLKKIDSIVNIAARSGDWR